MGKEGLTTKQKLFVEAYVGEARFNASAAARKAGYSEKTAGEQGFENLKKPEIRAAIDERLAAHRISSEEVLSELSDVAKADWREFVEVRHGKEGEVIDATLRLSDKLKALELVGKHYKLFSDRTELTGAGGGPIEKRVIYEVVNGGGATNNPNQDE